MHTHTNARTHTHTPGRQAQPIDKEPSMVTRQNWLWLTVKWRGRTAWASSLFLLWGCMDASIRGWGRFLFFPQNITVHSPWVCFHACVTTRAVVSQWREPNKQRHGMRRFALCSDDTSEGVWPSKAAAPTSCQADRHRHTLTSYWWSVRIRLPLWSFSLQ